MAVAACGTLAAAPAPAAAAVPARPAAPALPALADATPPIVRVMPLGDTITAGVGSSTDAGYRLPLWQRAAAQHRYTLHLVGSQRSGDFAEPWHEGHSGWKVDDIAQQVDGWLATQHPDVVLLQIGINDLDRGPDKPHAADRLAALVDRIFTDRPTVHLLLQGVLPTTAGLEDLARAYDRQAAGLVRTEQQRGRDLRYVVPPELTPAEFHDRLHPDDAGYVLLADAFYQAINADLAQHPLSRHEPTVTEPQLTDPQLTDPSLDEAPLSGSQGEFRVSPGAVPVP
jgi:lysophospholipase L1-like esterase